MLSYSVAIRTLGTNPTMLKMEIESIYAQTVKPDKVLLYIAEGYKVPDFRVADEIYVPVKKGMVRQRALRYDEIESPLVLMLDDDVYLPPHSVKLLIDTLESGGYDCVSPDTFNNHKMTRRTKLYSFFTNLSRPIRDSKYAFKIDSNGTLSYLSNPKEGVYESQSASGPCSIWRKDVFLRLQMEAETWLDVLKFSYAEDQLMFYKLHANGYRLGMYYGSGILHCDARTARNRYFTGTKMFVTRAKAQYVIWHRSIYSTRKGVYKKFAAASAILFKSLWLLPVHIAAAVAYRDIKVPYYYIKGTCMGLSYTHSDEYRNLPDFILKCD